MELLTYRLSDPNDKSKDLAKKITELVVASSVTIKEAMDAIRLSAEFLDEREVVADGTLHSNYMVSISAVACSEAGSSQHDGFLF